ncbi:MAG: hypothetical protein ICV68_08450, partial [Pyrinomonadaceae bacterium]|nr:hypothetical protein [Pyrinomonadaceae bacterium]
LILLTATPRVFDQLAYLKNSAEERFRTELLGIFRSFTTPETERSDARQQYSELLARAQANASCDNSSEPMTARAARAMRHGVERSTAQAPALGHREASDMEDASADYLIAAASALQSEQPSAIDEAAPSDKQDDVLLVARNFSDYPLFDEHYGPIAIDDAVIAQLEWKRDDEETPALPDEAASPKKPLRRGARFTRKFVWTNFQTRLPENMKLDNIIINTDALIKTRDHFSPAKPKCPVRVAPAAPEAPSTVVKPAIIS